MLLWIDTECSMAVLRHRLQAWTVPRGRFLVPEEPFKALKLEDEQDFRWISDRLKDYRPPLIVFDSLSGAHSVGENSEKMRLIMRRLVGLAAIGKIGLILIHHLNKSPHAAGHPVSLHRCRGAACITQYCASVLALTTPNPIKPEIRRLDAIKSNFSALPSPLGFTLTETGPAWSPATEFTYQFPTATERAVEFLYNALQEGPKRSEELLREVRTHKIGICSYYKARKVLGLRNYREGGKSGAYFLDLPEYDRITRK